MIIKNVTESDLQKALDAVNVIYDNNVTWNNYQRVGPGRYRVTLRVKDSYGPGARLGTSGLMGMGNPRHLPSACWHVHGRWFAALLGINENAVIQARGKTIDRYGGNWEDSNIGSAYRPVLFSEACECNERGIA